MILFKPLADKYCFLHDYSNVKNKSRMCTNNAICLKI